MQYRIMEENNKYGNPDEEVEPEFEIANHWVGIKYAMKEPRQYL